MPKVMLDYKKRGLCRIITRDIIDLVQDTYDMRTLGLDEPFS